jgi:hypothetical protein
MVASQRPGSLAGYSLSSVIVWLRCYSTFDRMTQRTTRSTRHRSVPHGTGRPSGTVFHVGRSIALARRVGDLAGKHGSRVDLVVGQNGITGD